MDLGGELMKNYVLIGLVMIILGITVFQAVQINSLKDQITGNAVTVVSQQGESYEQMMARMHPDQVQQKTVSTQSLPTMVGGC